MHIKLKKIGNSRGITLAKAVIDQYQFQDEIEMEFKKEGILIKRIQVIPREKWGNAYKKLNIKSKISSELDDYTENEFDKNDWTW